MTSTFFSTIRTIKKMFYLFCHASENNCKNSIIFYFFEIQPHIHFYDMTSDHWKFKWYFVVPMLI